MRKDRTLCVCARICAVSEHLWGNGKQRWSISQRLSSSGLILCQQVHKGFQQLLEGGTVNLMCTCPCEGRLIVVYGFVPTGGRAGSLFLDSQFVGGSLGSLVVSTGLRSQFQGTDPPLTPTNLKSQQTSLSKQRHPGEGYNCIWFYFSYC